MQCELSFFLLLHFSLDHFHPVDVAFDIVWMKENCDDIDFVIRWSVVQFLSTFLSKLLSHW